MQISVPRIEPRFSIFLNEFVTHQATQDHKMETKLYIAFGLCSHKTDFYAMFRIIQMSKYGMYHLIVSGL